MNQSAKFLKLKSLIYNGKFIEANLIIEAEIEIIEAGITREKATANLILEDKTNQTSGNIPNINTR